VHFFAEFACTRGAGRGNGHCSRIARSFTVPHHPRPASSPPADALVPAAPLTGGAPEHRFVYTRPLRVYWEVTRACDLACRHCRAEAVPQRDPRELTTAEGRRLLERLADSGDPPPHLVLTGGDPLKRADLFELIAIAREEGLPVSVAPSATPLLTADALRRLRAAGVDAISLSLDGSTAARHDAIRRISGTYERTLAAAATARAIGLPFQVNTLVCAETIDDVPAIYDDVVRMGAARWSLFFLVSVGRGQTLQPIAPACAEALLSWAAALPGPSSGRPMVTTTEAPHLRRIVLQQRRESGRAGARPGPGPVTTHAAGIRDGNGVLFISHVGDVSPSGFLEIPAGNVRDEDVLDIYRAAPLFRQLRDPDGFSGRCGLCEYRWVCGGSRARAFSATGDPLAEDPLCVHQPAATR
jgi:radical SAM protein